MLKKLGFLSEAPDKLRWLDNSGKIHFTHTNTQRLATFSIPNPCTAETQNEFYGKGSLVPRDALACGAFFKAFLPCPVPWVEQGVYKNGGFGKPPWYRTGRPLRCERETPTQQDL